MDTIKITSIIDVICRLASMATKDSFHVIIKRKSLETSEDLFQITPEMISSVLLVLKTFMENDIKSINLKNGPLRFRISIAYNGESDLVSWVSSLLEGFDELIIDSVTTKSLK